MKLEVTLERSVRGGFFDRQVVKDALDAATQSVLGRFGDRVRKAARQSIRQTKNPKPSPPGKPPRSRTGALRDGIVYAYDQAQKAVVVGPMKLNRSTPAPALHELGGQTTVQEKDRVKTAVYPARPYMRPAFEKKLPQLPGLWRNAMKRKV